ncbi:DUF4350 domain-containing protein [Microbacterium sp. BR1]|uniref:DUF4350 domain-containing protein n=1 Tax=Microbacterium sp. BR1 TaxID=1070896 RepID=UPI0018E20ADF|nr:DUF4350 domain-containing protein [Microbacterium sp. BR1]
MTPDAVGTVPASRRRAVVWISIVAFVILVGIAGALLSGIGTWTERDRLDPESVGPGGTAALVAILREQGVAVAVTRDRDETLRLLGAAPTTLVMADSPILGDDALREIFEAATDIVLVDPRARGVELLFPGATAGGFAPAETVAPECDAAPARRAGSVMPGRLLVPGTSGAAGCYPAGDGFGLLIGAGADRRVSAFDGRGLITNDSLASDGNAALALNLMGRLPDLVWYVPALTDSDVATEPTLGELTPGWVTPAIVLLGASAVAAALWRGRRFGPLVVERLPVTARATETMEGRGRLYEHGGDTVHAADALRLGTLERLRRALALPPAAGAAQIADASADLAGISHRAARDLLIEDEPRGERELLALSDGLRTLEAAVARGIRGETPPDPMRPDDDTGR